MFADLNIKLFMVDGWPYFCQFIEDFKFLKRIFFLIFIFSKEVYFWKIVNWKVINKKTELENFKMITLFITRQAIIHIF